MKNQHLRSSPFHKTLNTMGALALFIFLFHKENILKTHFLSHLSTTKKPTLCTELYDHKGYKTSCEYLLANPQCGSSGFFDYTKFFYCNCEKNSVLGYWVLIVWLVSLIYMLSNNASEYFCCCLKHLSYLLKLPPVVAGVSLLPIGNGSPDIFSALAGAGAGDLGLNSVLGAVLFVTCVVVGMVCFRVGGEGLRIDKKCFIRDVFFSLLVLVSLMGILVVGEVSVSGGIAFVSIYVVYGFFVVANEMFRKEEVGLKLDCVDTTPLLRNEKGGDEIVCVCVDVEFVETNVANMKWGSKVDVYSKKLVDSCGFEEGSKPLWGWNEEERENEQSSLSCCSKLCGWFGLPLRIPGRTTNPFIEEERENHRSSCGFLLLPLTLLKRPTTPISENERENHRRSLSCSKVCGWLELPLILPRRLTIPIVEEGRWSKGYAVACASLAPMLLAYLWTTKENMVRKSEEILCFIGVAIGVVLGVLAIIFTRADRPPQRFLFPWVLGGFFMSIVWFYIIANELVAVLVALGVVFTIKPSILGLTVLAWGNSMGDLVSVFALAASGAEGLQIAMSGCYAGPIFNMIAGLGISMLIGAWSNRPASYAVPLDSSLYYTIGFVMLGLVWSLIVLPKNNMVPNKILGIGLFAIYLAFLSLRLSMAIGEGSVDSF